MNSAVPEVPVSDGVSVAPPERLAGRPATLLTKNVICKDVTLGSCGYYLKPDAMSRADTFRNVKQSLL